MNSTQLRKIKKLFIFTGLAGAVITLILTAGCARRVEVKREWPMPLKINPSIIKQCNAIHNRTCPEKSGVMSDAVYYFDRRKLPAIETDLKKTDPTIKSEQDETLILKKIEFASAYSATFIRTECSIEYYVEGKNVTCEKFLNYIEKMKNDCDNCLEIIKVDPEQKTPTIIDGSNEKLFFE